eukprot:2726924-Amphidinium_carterae.1
MSLSCFLLSCASVNSASTPTLVRYDTYQNPGHPKLPSGKRRGGITTAISPTKVSQKEVTICSNDCPIRGPGNP